MSSYISLLGKVFPYMDADVKYFLIKIVQHFEFNEEMNIPVNILRSELGVTDRLITKSFSKLVKNDILVKVNKYKGKGRPCNSYAFTEEFKNMFKDVEQPNCSNHLLIDELLLPDTGIVRQSNRLDEKRHPLGISTKLVLIILLYHASAEGIVDKLGMADIAKLSGLSINAAKESIQKLKRKKYIRCSVGGVSSALMFEKCKSHYHLNLSRNLFSNGRVSTIFVYHSASLLEACNIFEYANRLITKHKPDYRHGLFKSPEMLKNWPEDRFSKIATFFSERKRSRVMDFLQLKIEFYASMLLSKCWDNLTNKDIESEIIYLINRDIYKSTVKFGSNKEMEKLFCLFLYDVILMKAKNVKRTIVKREKDCSLNKMKHIIIPQISFSRYSYALVIESFYDECSCGSISPFYIGEWNKEFWIKKKCEDINLSKLNLLSNQEV